MSVFASGEVEAQNPWVRESPPTVNVLAAYMTLFNHTDKKKTVLRITSTHFDRVEIHRTEMHDDMAHMVPVSKVIISPNGKVVFEPGGLHIMLIGPKGKLKKGDNIQLALHFSDNSTVAITAPVKQGHGMGGHHMDMEDHSKHGMDHDSEHSENMNHHDNHSDNHSNNQMNPMDEVHNHQDQEHHH
jgi:copper(I)-binding protein